MFTDGFEKIAKAKKKKAPKKKERDLSEVSHAVRGVFDKLESKTEEHAKAKAKANKKG